MTVFFVVPPVSTMWSRKMCSWAIAWRLIVNFVFILFCKNKCLSRHVYILGKEATWISKDEITMPTIEELGLLFISNPVGPTSADRCLKRLLCFSLSVHPKCALVFLPVCLQYTTHGTFPSFILSNFPSFILTGLESVTFASTLPEIRTMLMILR